MYARCTTSHSMKEMSTWEIRCSHRRSHKFPVRHLQRFRCRWTIDLCRATCPTRWYSTLACRCIHQRTHMCPLRPRHYLYRCSVDRCTMSHSMTDMSRWAIRYSHRRSHKFPVRHSPRFRCRWTIDRRTVPSLLVRSSRRHKPRSLNRFHRFRLRSTTNCRLSRQTPRRILVRRTGPSGSPRC